MGKPKGFHLLMGKPKGFHLLMGKPKGFHLLMGKSAKEEPMLFFNDETIVNREMSPIQAICFLLQTVLRSGERFGRNFYMEATKTEVTVAQNVFDGPVFELAPLIEALHLTKRLVFLAHGTDSFVFGQQWDRIRTEVLCQTLGIPAEEWQESRLDIHDRELQPLLELRAENPGTTLLELRLATCA